VFSQETLTKTPFSVEYNNYLDAEMKKTALAITLTLTALLFVSQIQTSRASDKLYLWELHNEGAQVEAEYQIRITASDSWRRNVPYEVNIRMISKNSYPISIDSAKAVLKSENFSLESLSQETPIQPDPTESRIYEEKFAFNIPAEKLIGGENFTVSAIAVITLSSVAGSNDGLNGTWDNYANPVIVSLYFPSQSTLPTQSPESTPIVEPFPTTLLIGSVVAVAVAVVGLGLLVYLKKRRRNKSP
jgi:multisubunit Na+/H+ antiporter MnhC subunit